MDGDQNMELYWIDPVDAPKGGVCRRSLSSNALLCWRVAWRSAGSIACPLNFRNERNMHNPRIVHNTRKMHNMHNMRNMRIMHNTLFCFRRRIE